MEQKIPENTTFKPENYHHVGVIVRDIEKTVEYLTSIGIGPFGIKDGPLYVEVPFKGEFHGKPAEWKVKISNAKVGDSELELLQPSGGESALQEFLDNHGEGLHHIAYLVDDVQAEIEKQVKQGVKVITSANLEGRGFAYLDTGVVGGIVTEIRFRE
ncbi:MAG: VOC family protein [Dehalococcoidales bacterium]|nr:VOC family protein [Dehalococcoidales bacterium]